jgi:aspartyl-tRNA(Asn)/glutamyl-tRNA(Gln) amidotransferase subunit A
MSFAQLSILETGVALRRGDFTARELTEATLSAIDASNDTLHAFIRVLPDLALAQAAQADRDFAAGIDRGPMQGIPFAVKDLFDIKGIETTCHSRRGPGLADANAAVIDRLLASGAVAVAKTATFEFATYGPDAALPYPLARNPWNLDHFTGGSSSGSAVAIAGGLVRMALGTDTGGSIRTPSSWSGTVGIKPTFGRVSRRGCFPLSWSLDHVGPLARSVEDAAISLQVMAGHDALDSDCSARAVADYAALLGRDLAGMRIGLARRLLQTATGDVVAGVERAAVLLQGAGAEVIEVDTPDLGDFGAVVRALLLTEGHHIHAATMRAHYNDLGPMMARRIALGAGYSALDYLAVQKLRRMLAEAVSTALSACDVLLCATTPRVAPHKSADPNPFDPAGPSMTNPFNVTGNPAISVPIGLDAAGLPLAVQLVGRLFDEPRLLQVAQVVERASGWAVQALPDWRAQAEQEEERV